LVDHKIKRCFQMAAKTVEAPAAAAAKPETNNEKTLGPQVPSSKTPEETGVKIEIDDAKQRMILLAGRPCEFCRGAAMKSMQAQCMSSAESAIASASGWICKAKLAAISKEFSVWKINGGCKMDSGCIKMTGQFAAGLDELLACNS
jgi:hypothetical protein